MAKPLFAEAKVSQAKKKATVSPRRMSLRLGEGRWTLQKLAICFTIFGPFKGPFPKAYKLGFFRLVKGSIFENENTLLRASLLFLLSHLGFFIFFSFTLFLEFILKS